MNARRDMGAGDDRSSLPDDYDERAVESPRELNELVQLRTELTWSGWKSHPRFKKARVLREALKKFGGSPANDVDPPPVTDECFTAVCDARRDSWMESIENDKEPAVEPQPAGGSDHG